MGLCKAADPVCSAWAVPQDGLLGGEGSAGQMKRRQQVQEGSGGGDKNRHVPGLRGFGASEGTLRVNSELRPECNKRHCFVLFFL